MRLTHTTLTMTALPETPWRQAALEALRVVRALEHTAVRLHCGALDVVIMPGTRLSDLEAHVVQFETRQAWLTADGARQRAQMGLETYRAPHPHQEDDI